MRKLLILAGLTCVVGAACSPADNVIRQTSPFERLEDGYVGGTRSAIISRARRFAQENGFDFSAEEFGPEGFSILLARADLNLIAIHSTSANAPVEIDGIARGVPAESHRTMLTRFRTFIRGDVGDQR